MTSAVRDRPHTALDLLFGPGNDTPEALARQLMSAGTGRDLGRALENLPRASPGRGRPRDHGGGGRAPESRPDRRACRWVAQTS